MALMERRADGGNVAFFPDHSLDSARMRAELWISAVSWPIGLRTRMVEHLADSLAANACLANDLPNWDTLSEDLIPDAQPLRDVAVHGLVFLSTEH